MENNVEEELLRIVVEFLQSEEGNLNKAVDLAIDFSTEKSIYSDHLLDLSSYCLSEGFYELAYILAKTTLSSLSGYEKATAHYNAGTASYFLNLLIEAEEQYKLAIELDPNDSDTHYNYGILLKQMGQLQEAEEQYKLALVADPKHVNTHSNYGILLKQMDRLQEAEEQYKLAIELDPNDSDTHYNYGNLLSDMGRLQEAEEQYKLALEADPKHVNTHSNYGSLLKQMDRLQEAEEQYKLALVADPKHVNTHSNYGSLLKQMDRLQEAEEQYKLALEADPNDADTHSNYGSLLKQMGQLQEAEEQYKLALEAKPKHVNTHYNYGNLLSDMGRLQEAEEQYKTAIELNPNMPNSHGAYGLLLFSQNLEEEAINETEIASRLFRENGDKVKEHLSLAWLYEEFTDKYYNLEEYKKSGNYAEISGDEYIEAGKQAGEKFKGTSLTKGYTLKGRAIIRRFELQPPYEIENFKKIMSGIDDASKCYKKASEASPTDNQTCNACSISMRCLSEMLDYMIAVIKQDKVSRLENEVERWKVSLNNCEKIYKGSEKGENFIKSLYKLMACIENLDKYKKFAMWKEDRAFEECVEELKEIAGNIEGPLQKIIKDSAAQMDICRRKIMPYVGTETGQFKPEAPKIEVNPKIEVTHTPVEPKRDDLEKNREEEKKNRIIKWIFNHPIKFAGSVVFAVLINHFSEPLFSMMYTFVSTLLNLISTLFS